MKRTLKASTVNNPHNEKRCGGGESGKLYFGDIFDRCEASLKNVDKI
jgi:hypothetical protein